nr:hypothetical protein [uncultured Brumimicrobium sp.]
MRLLHKFSVGLAVLFSVFLFSSCENKSDICECFEVRLAIKNLLKSVDQNKDATQSEEYEALKAKKTECMLTIEPQYFEEKGLERKGRSDKEFLLEELPDCKAVKTLFNGD